MSEDEAKLLKGAKIFGEFVDLVLTMARTKDGKPSSCLLESPPGSKDEGPSSTQPSSKNTFIMGSKRTAKGSRSLRDEDSWDEGSNCFQVPRTAASRRLSGTLTMSPVKHTIRRRLVDSGSKDDGSSRPLVPESLVAPASRPQRKPSAVASSSGASKAKGKAPVKVEPTKGKGKKANVFFPLSVDEDFVTKNIKKAPKDTHEAIKRICGVRWVDDRARQTYHTYPNRCIVPEQRVLFDKAQKAYVEVAEQFQRRGWSRFCEPPGYYYENWVREFYANLSASENGSYIVTVRGQDVNYGASKIRRLLGLEQVTDVADYQQHLGEKSLARFWYGPIIAKEGCAPTWTAPGGVIRKSQMKYTAKCWLKFVANRVRPSRNDDTLTLPTGVLIASIMEKAGLDLAEVIYGVIEKRAHQPDRNLPYPCLVTKLMERAKVPLLPADKKIECTTELDFFKIQDEDNPQKRKLLGDALAIVKRARVEEPSDEDESDKEGLDDDAATDDVDAPAAEAEGIGPQDRPEQSARGLTFRPPSSSRGRTSSASIPPVYRLPMVMSGPGAAAQLPSLITKVGEFMGTLMHKFDQFLRSGPAKEAHVTEAARSIKEVIEKEMGLMRGAIEKNTTAMEAMNRDYLEMTESRQQPLSTEQIPSMGGKPDLYQMMEKMQNEIYNLRRGIVDDLSGNEGSWQSDDEDERDDEAADSAELSVGSRR